MTQHGYLKEKEKEKKTAKLVTTVLSLGFSGEAVPAKTVETEN